MEELKIDLFGRVQGVGFRQFVKKTADALKIRGYVRNCDDGRVSTSAQGSRKQLQEFLFKLEKGPFLSKVEGVSYLWKKPVVKYPDFVISVNRGFIDDQKASFANLGKRIFKTQLAVPQHVAIIPDGNRRWAKEKGLIGSAGHEAAATYDRFFSILNEADSLGVKHVTFWVFSTENWKRDKVEVNFLFNLLENLLAEFSRKSEEHKFRFRHLGRSDRIPKTIIELIKKLEERTRGFDGLQVNFCLDYGGRDEIVRAVNKMLREGKSEVHEDELAGYLDTEGIPDPDLIIRTSGERRMSGFMPFQGTYAEYYFTPINFPDFGPEELRMAVEDFGERKRNFGK